MINMNNRTDPANELLEIGGGDVMKTYMGPRGLASPFTARGQRERGRRIWGVKAGMLGKVGHAVRGSLALLGITLVVSPGSDQAFAQGGTWSVKAPMPTARASLGTGAANGIMYAVGGCTSSCAILTNQAYDPVSDTWATKAPMPNTTPQGSPQQGFNCLAVGVINGILYATGDRNGTFYSMGLEAYDPESDTWTQKAPPPTARSNFAAGVVNGVLYAVGGNYYSNGSFFYLSTVEAYDPVSDAWTAKAPMPTARAGLAIGVVNGTLYAVGGSNGTNILSVVEAYDPVSDTWTAKASMPTVRAGLAIGVLNGMLYAVGGSNGAYPLPTVEAYTPASDTWTTGAPMPTATAGLGTGVANGVLYAIGGGGGAGVLATNQAFTPLPLGTAELSGGNSFTGDQMVTGTVSATHFVGDGSGLTGITVQSANTANFATAAGDAATLGGNLPSAFAPANGSPNYVTKGGDTMTGMLNLPSNGLGVGGNQLVVSGGNVGIGTATPDSVASYTSLGLDQAATGFGGTFLQLSHSATSNKARIVSDPNGLLLCSGCGGNTTPAPLRIKAGEVTNGTDSHVYIQTNGNVGIGTVTPGQKLDVAGNINASGVITAASFSGNLAASSLICTGCVGNTQLGVNYAGSATQGGAANFATTAGDAATLSGNPPSAFAPANGSPNYVAKGGDTMTGRLNLPSNGLDVGGNQLVVSGGNVGIGTASPDSVASYNSLGLDQAATGFGGTFLQLSHSATSNKARIVSDPNGLLLCSGCGGNTIPAPVRIKAGEVTNGTDSHLYILTNGNVGIGTVTPGQKLDVAGNVNASGTITAASFSGSLTTSSLICAACVGNAQLGVNYAGSATQGGAAATALLANLATNASALDGVAAGSYARVDIGNAFVGNQGVTGNLSVSGNSAMTGAVTIGGGTAITKHISTVFNVAFNTKLAPGTCVMWSGAIPSAADGDSIAAGLGSTLMSANIVYSAWAINGGLQLRICNPTGAPVTLGAGNIRIDIWKH